ncbi:MAG: hypothetical protein RQ783_03950 [Gammaproteobacteria bacterium]|nr:hypothetical protein [Gammaproteobacteria bacterium]
MPIYLSKKHNTFIQVHAQVNYSLKEAENGSDNTHIPNQLGCIAAMTAAVTLPAAVIAVKAEIQR